MAQSTNPRNAIIEGPESISNFKSRENVMNQILIISAIGGLVAFSVNTATIPLVKNLALAVRAVDHPGGRRNQTSAIPRLGGVAVVWGIFCGMGVQAVFQGDVWKGSFAALSMATILLAVGIVSICGFLEDIVGLSQLKRFLIQILAALLVILSGCSFQVIHLPWIGDLRSGLGTALISLIWIVGVTNAINLMDGLDGLAGGVVTIIASGLMVLSFWHADPVIVTSMATVVGSCLGFLRKNWAPAQIYMGDAGSLTLGFILALASIHSCVKGPTTIAFLLPILLLGLPVIDTLLVMLYRFVRKARGPLCYRVARMFRADCSHLHHLMMRLVPSRARLVLLIYSVVLAFCLLALLVADSKLESLGILLIGIEISVIFCLRQLGLHADRIKRLFESHKSACRSMLSLSGIKEILAMKHGA
jgi:UDP-GlcNAc:undecaprenyl-phosphate GlcNAc-1-phosphate transferase